MRNNPNWGKKGFKKGHIMSQEVRDKISKTEKAHPHTYDQYQKSCRKLRTVWDDPIIVKKMFAGLNKRPTIPEKTVEKILNQNFPNEYKYVGNGNFTLGRKCPDFLNVNGQKKIIEVFGRIFHDPEAAVYSVKPRYDQTEQGRIELFKKYGFNTLIIWDDELEDENTVIDKIREFNAHEGALT